MENPVLFGRYRLLERAGAGGSAQVWRAIDEHTGDEVAVKRLHPVVLADPAARRRLERESRALEGIRHPSVVRLRDVRVEPDEAALILDYVPGVSLAERLGEGGPLAVGEAVSVARDVAAALSAAHAVGIVHRDIKPGNIILAPDGSAHLTDFGIALDGDAASALTATQLTAAGTVIGSFRYMAPEQLRGSAASPASDQYGLAAVTYEMLAGRPPYPAATPVELAEQQAGDPAPLEGARPDLGGAIRRALARNPRDRYPDVTAFAEALRSAVRASPAHEDTETIPVVGAPVGVDAATAAARTGSRAAARLPRRRWAPAAAVAALGLGALLVLGSLGAGPGAETQPDAGTTAEPPPAAPVTSRPAEEADDGADDDEPSKGDSGGKGKSNGKGKDGDKGSSGDKGKGRGRD